MNEKRSNILKKMINYGNLNITTTTKKKKKYRNK